MITVPLEGGVGAEISGVTSDDLIDGEVVDGVLAALEAHGVLVFRALHVEPEAQVAFCRRLGELDLEEGYHPVRGIQRVTRDVGKRPNADYVRGTFHWHMDGCTPLNDEAPQKATMLSAIAVASEGGETEFASTYAAFDALDDAEQEAYERLRVVHTLEASLRRVNSDPTTEQIQGWRSRRPNELPLVWRHKSGRKSLVIGASADHIVGIGADVSRSLLDDLEARATAPDRVYRHTWQVGDSVVWDNHGLLHRASPYPADSPREMLRTTVLGDEHIR